MAKVKLDQFDDVTLARHARQALAEVADRWRNSKYHDMIAATSKMAGAVEKLVATTSKSEPAATEETSQ